MNKGCLNALWHFPFLGFIFAFIYAFYGVLACCTIVLIPAGKGYFQIAKYLLSPYSSAIVSLKDMALIKPELAEVKPSNTGEVFNIIARILIFPFGLVAAGMGFFNVIYQFISIIGIFTGLVWWRLLPSIFNPVNKVCVPREVADEIERVKSGAVVSDFKQEANETNNTACNSTQGATVVARVISQNVTGVRGYTEEKLQEIIDNPAMYQPTLVEACRHELEVRNESVNFAEQVKSFDNEKIAEILSNTTLYSDALVYAVELDMMERKRIQLEKETEEREAERQRLEKEAEEQRKQNIAWWKKWGWLVGLSVVAAIATIVVANIIHTQNVNRERIAVAKEKVTQLNEKAISQSCTIDKYRDDINHLTSILPELVTEGVKKEICSLEYEISEVKRRVKLLNKFAKYANEGVDETPEIAEQRVDNAREELHKLEDQIHKTEKQFDMVITKMGQDANVNYHHGNKYTNHTNYNRANALYDTAYKYYTKKNYKAAFNYFYKAASYGQTDAINYLGVCYYNGEGVNQSIKSAFLIYKVAASVGDKYAKYNLGVCYEHGKGVAKDMEKAKHYYTSAARSYHKDAREKCRELGIGYY